MIALHVTIGLIYSEAMGVGESRYVAVHKDDLLHVTIGLIYIEAIGVGESRYVAVHKDDCITCNHRIDIY